MRTPWQLHLIALIVVISTLSAEALYLFAGTKSAIPEVLIGRILGTFDMALALVLAYYFTATIVNSRAPQRASDTPVPPEPPKGTP